MCSNILLNQSTISLQGNLLEAREKSEQFRPPFAAIWYQRAKREKSILYYISPKMMMGMMMKEMVITTTTTTASTAAAIAALT